MKLSQRLSGVATTLLGVGMGVETALVGVGT